VNILLVGEESAGIQTLRALLVTLIPGLRSARDA